MLGKMTYYDTVFRTCDTTYLSQPGILVGSAAEQSAIRKSIKYALQPATHVVISVAFKTLGPVKLCLHSCVCIYIVSLGAGTSHFIYIYKCPKRSTRGYFLFQC